MAKRVIDVAIIGGGCAGLFTALKLRHEGLSCLVYDSKPFSGFSSTRNQGWLQSGAFYCGQGDTDVAQDCARGFAHLVDFCNQHCPEAVRDETECYLLFRTAADREQTIEARPGSIAIDKIDIRDVIAKEPILKDTPFEAAARISDRPFDTNAVLTAVATLAHEKGAQFHYVGEFGSLQIRRQDDCWLISCDSAKVHSHAVVLSCGPLSKTLLGQVGSNFGDRIEITKVPVYGLHAQIASSMLVTNVELAPNLVPYNIRGQHGVTVCINKADELTASHNDFKHPNNHDKVFADRVSWWFPGVSSIVGRGVPCKTYICQKINIAGDRKRRHFIENHGSTEKEELWNLLTFYPGKFTVSPLAAEECVKVIKGQRSPVRTTVDQTEYAGPVTVANQRFLRAPAHKLHASSGILELSEGP